MSALRVICWILLQVLPSVGFFMALYGDWVRKNLAIAIPVWLVVQVGAVLEANRGRVQKLLAHRSARRRLRTYSQAVVSQIVHLIPGIPEPIDRTEVDTIAKLLKLRQRVLLVGEAGTGKTGILWALASQLCDRPLILLDARDFADCKSFEDMGQRLALTGVGIVDCLRRWGRRRRAVLVLDQCDSVMHTAAGNLVLDFVMNCSAEPRLGLVFVTRPHESKGMVDLLKIKSDVLTREVKSQPLSANEATRLLECIGVTSPTPEVTELARNLLELSMIGDLVQTNGADSLEGIDGELGLWERYRLSLAGREGATRSPDAAIAERAIGLAAESLKHLRGTCQLTSPRTREDERLLSRQVLVKDVGERYRFRHERFRDYLFAWDATKRKQWSLADIKDAIGAGQAGVVSDWVVRLYEEMDDGLAASFLAEMLND